MTTAADSAATSPVPFWRALPGRLRVFLFGPALGRALPERVRRAIAAAEDETEILVSLVQLGAIVTFALLYGLAPKAFPPGTTFEPVPWALGVYAGFVLLRLHLALRRRLTPPFLVASAVVDVAVLMVMIWSFHLQYQAPAALYLKAPTLMHIFIIIALRALRFDPRYVLLTGALAAAGWLALVAYALLADHVPVTRSYAVYMTSYSILLGAEFDKMMAIGAVTVVLALAITRARGQMVRAAAEGQAAAELARFFPPDVARRIAGADMAIRPGEAERREAAILFVDLRGFTPLTAGLAPEDVMALLSDYQSRVVPIIRAHGGSVDKFMGDGILASFGATRPNPRFSADALGAVDAILAAADAWIALRRAAGLAAPGVGASVAVGPVMFGAIGDERRLEYTVIGDTVNLAAKLEKHSKAEGARALTTAESFALALAQGHEPGPACEHRARRAVPGVAQPIDLVVLG